MSFDKLVRVVSKDVGWRWRGTHRGPSFSFLCRVVAVFDAWGSSSGVVVLGRGRSSVVVVAHIPRKGEGRGGVGVRVTGVGCGWRSRSVWCL